MDINRLPKERELTSRVWYAIEACDELSISAVFGVLAAIQYELLERAKAVEVGDE